jgi:alkylated DNA repair dioxygenase AlkB
MAAPYIYTPRFVRNPDFTKAVLTGSIQWERRDDAPRCEYYCNDFKAPYTYGKGRGRRTYEPHPYPPALMEIRKELEKETGYVYEACFLNRYLNQSDHLGWHADDSPEMDDARPIATISLGVARQIQFKPKDDKRPLEGSLLEEMGTKNLVESVMLENGSLCLMLPGMQDSWYHRIPKASFQCGERVSLVFRGYVGTPGEVLERF